MYDYGITLNGFYQVDPELLEGVPLPEGLDNKILTDLIIERCGDMFPFIQAPTYLKRQVKNWFTTNYRNFERSLLAVNTDYSPIENYDRYEDNLRDTNETLENSTSSNTSAENINQRAADNSESFRNTTRDTASANDRSNATGESARNEIERIHAHGNIGTTKNTEMIFDEIELRKYNIYEDIAARFEDKFIISIY